LANPHWTDLFNISIYLPGFVKKFIKIFYLGFAAKSFSWGQGVGCGVWGVGFYRFSGGQLPNFQGKNP